MAKSRSNSILKSRAEQSEEFGEMVFAWCLEPKTEDCSGGYQHAREQLVSDGIKVSIGVVSEFFGWWGMRRDFQAINNFTQDVQEMLTRELPDVPLEKIEKAGDLVFTMKAANAGNGEEWREMQYLKIAKESAAMKAELESAKLELRKMAEARMQGTAALAREKFEIEACEKILAAVNDAKVRSIAESNVPKAEKIAQLRQEYFADIDALQASGEIELPK
ncbi:MAG: hypothetical protein ABIT76_08685 [Chthoniobacterales bacterium]